MTSDPAPTDLFAEIFGPCDEAAAGLPEQLQLEIGLSGDHAEKARHRMSANLAHDPFDDRDVFGLLPLEGAVPDSVLAGLAKLADAPPLWGERSEWTELVDRLRAFALRWHSPATAAGWSAVELFGLDANAPRARVGRLGGGWLACSRSHQVVGVDATGIRLVTRTSARLSIYRPEDGGVLAWELTEPAGCRQSGSAA